MRIYIVRRSTCSGECEYRSFVAIASSPEAARHMNPGTKYTWPVDHATLEVTCIGLAHSGLEEGIVHKSFNG